MMLAMNEENSALSVAGQEMMDACYELNAYAILVRDKLRDDLAAHQRVLNILDECEAATSKLEELARIEAY